MRVGIHQINYFPWMGYFNKIAKSDVFIFLDEVQLTDNGMMQRNRIMNKKGEPSYITIAFNKKDYLERKFCEIELNENINWQQKQYNLLFDAYHKLPAWKEVIERINPIFFNTFHRLQEVNECSIQIVNNILGIDTKIIYQSSLDYDRNRQKNDLVLSLCQACKADTYLSGNGARKYMDLDSFKDAHINVQFQTFEFPEYPQAHALNFTPGLSILDMLFNCGIEKTRMIFWESICNNEQNL